MSVAMFHFLHNDGSVMLHTSSPNRFCDGSHSQVEAVFGVLCSRAPFAGVTEIVGSKH